MTEARHDPVVHRFKPDPELVARAQRAMMEDEEATNPRLRFVRQRWEEAYGAVRVALDVLREIYPSEVDLLEDEDAMNLEDALRAVTVAYAQLDELSEKLLGAIMHDVLTGAITSHAELDALEVPR